MIYIIGKSTQITKKGRKEYWVEYKRLFKKVKQYLKDMMSCIQVENKGKEK